MAEFKRLSEVEVVAEPSESAKILIEEDGTIKRLDKLELGGGKADWNQNDPDGEGYISNRPFYDEMTVVSTLFENSDVPLNTLRNNGISLFELVGKTYKVVFDGVEYICEVKRTDYNAFIGNTALVTFIPEGGLGTIVDTGEPFCLVHHSYDHDVRYTYPEYEEHTYSFYEVENVAHKIDTKYLPSGLGGYILKPTRDEVIPTAPDSLNVTTDCTDMVNTLENGGSVMLLLPGEIVSPSTYLFSPFQWRVIKNQLSCVINVDGMLTNICFLNAPIPSILI